MAISSAMFSLDDEGATLMLRIARYLRQHGERSCPLSAVGDAKKLRPLLRGLSSMRLISVDDEGVQLTVYGWSWVCAKEPDIVKREKHRK
jgi:hypothetical protein